MRSCTLFLTFIFLILFSPLAQAFELRGMDQPESFIVDPSTGIYYVSNIVGSHKGKDNKAFIAKIDASGKLIDRHFISGGKKGVTLNAPKGLVISGKNLYVTDIDVVRRFDKESGKMLGTIDFSLLGAKFLNDIALGPKGVLFVSDMMGNVIFKIDPGKNNQVSILAKGPDLGKPNGLVYEISQNRLLVAPWESGKILGVDMQGNIMTVFQGSFFQGLKHLDGIDLDRDGNIIVSIFKGGRIFSAGKIYRIKNYSTVEVLRKNLVTPADISIDHKNNQVLVPSVDGNLVFTFPLK